MINVLISARHGHYDPSDFILESPDRIRTWSFGEVRKANSLSPLTHRPIEEGLFCPNIFGHSDEYSDPTGLSSRNEHPVYRFGHVNLALPCVNIRFLPWIASVLNISESLVDSIIHGKSFVVTKSIIPSLNVNSIISEDDYYAAWKNYDGEDDFAETGGASLKFILSGVNITQELKSFIDSSISEKKYTSADRFTVLERLRASGSRPEWMLFEAFPVIPPFMRPMKTVGDRKCVSSIINQRYALMINRNNRLHRLIELKSPSIILQIEARLLQQAINELVNSISKSIFLCKTDSDGQIR
jgi:DNA-directed RNA polymerase beta' subunit